MDDAFGLIVTIVLLLVGFIFMIVAFKYGMLWIRATLAGAHVSIFQLVGMSLRKVPPRIIVDARVMLVKGGIEVDAKILESLYLAGGNVERVAMAVISANKAKIVLPIERAIAIDLAHRDVLDAVMTTVKPKIIDCPDTRQTGANMLDAVARDGIRLLVRARVTVRTNLDRLVGGATEETIIARVGQGIVSAIGSSNSYKDVLENPDRISQKVLNSGLDSQTAYEIVSIDIADVSVAGMQGREVANVGALLEAERAETDKKLRQAEAEGRRAMAVALEQEMRALIQENRAKVTLAEAEVPKAMAEAFRNGRLGVMDYYNMKNVMADTDMRNAIAGNDAGDNKKSEGTKEI
ncbi:MAG: hypothetical protein A3F84_02220 [Candidatus Handelsmanbacteria bacterium RIFCSPLOWO2_12_FULL_64_10]|uniref:Flotillin-like protein FloA n=1 Tax=Handelsmanbacteria sp. (strain RIFCSPLOWO2_12_FULL_64_10) TaxID=1817868 RepID=A0A1F6CLV9_HANXR|nr:MAG: hypothetical protein A3F84_02220 [Candidatus Handelsmanbacteria bacterium RIFCSPLOWO2_12_FULL_64_10]